MSDLLGECSRSEKGLRERLEAAAGEGDAKARLASVRSELEAVSLERDALVSLAPFSLTLACHALSCLAFRLKACLYYDRVHSRDSRVSSLALLE